MKKRISAVLLPMALAISITLTGCGANNNTDNAKNVESDHIENGSNNNMNTPENSGETQTSPNEQVGDTTKVKEPTKVDIVNEVKRMLVMKGAVIPTSFPVTDGYHLTAAIQSNETESFEVTFYQTKAVTPVNDPSLKSVGDAEVIATFKANTYNDPDNETDIFFPIDTETGPVAVDLGHGIKGITEGAAGHSYLSWSEGRWIITIGSATEDQMDNQAIAKKMVNYLENNYLPAPQDQGRIKVSYPSGGKEVHVGIYWQDGNVIYELETDEVPINAMGMIVE